MQKIQVLFPDPVMRRLRRLAAKEDRPVSEVIRRAVERLLNQSPHSETPAESKPRRLPTYRAGAVLTEAENMKALIYADDDV